VIRRGHPCPCGSGRKFKRCCLLKSPGPGERTTGQFRFEPGSYGGRGRYMPSLACFRESAPGVREYSFVLVNPSDVLDSESDAVGRATADFSKACRVDDATGSIAALGRQLSGFGYVVVENFKVVGEEDA
jgi:hypothetical protein